jgi:hypothetical protein
MFDSNSNSNSSSSSNNRTIIIHSTPSSNSMREEEEVESLLQPLWPSSSSSTSSSHSSPHFKHHPHRFTTLLRWLCHWPWRRKPKKPRQRLLLAFLGLCSLLWVVHALWLRPHLPKGTTLLGGLGLIRRHSPPPQPNFRCPNPRTSSGGGGSQSRSEQVDHNRPGPKIDAKALLFVETTFSKVGRDVAELLVHSRIKYKVEVAGKGLPLLTNGDKVLKLKKTS